MKSDLSLALALADAADTITMKFFKSQSLAVRTKADATPVSEADEAVERMIRERLAADRPDDGIVGEEEGTTGSTARRWILDPIDGTKNYVRGIPVFATLIALEVDGAGEVAVVSAPALGRRWWASRGEGAFLNGEPIHVSAVNECREAHFAYDSITDFEKAGLTANFISLVHRVGRTRAFGDFWSHMLVAEGSMEIAIEPEVAHWDMAAVKVIVEEAGGQFTTLAGEATAAGGSGVSTNGLLHECVLEMFR
ncbi:MAG: inositol monophosphatase family protein [Thermoanaerobaculia bacterium]